MLDHNKYVTQWLANYKTGGAMPNDSKAEVGRVAATGWRFVLLGIHHLTGDENRSKSNLYMLVRDANGNRLNEKIEWGWIGQSPKEIANPVTLDKPNNEPDGNISIGKNQVIWAKVLGKPSDIITGVLTILPDEIEPGGQKWNTIGHHSHLACWAWLEGNAPPIPPIVPDCAEVRAELAAKTLAFDRLLAAVRELGK